MTKPVLKKSLAPKIIPVTGKLLSEMMPDLRSVLRAASQNLMEPRKEAIEALLLKAAAQKNN